MKSLAGRVSRAGAPWKLKCVRPYEKMSSDICNEEGACGFRGVPELASHLPGQVQLVR